MIDIIIISALVILAAFTAGSVIKRKDRCSCGCKSCSNSCCLKKEEK